jgi:serine/threonine protein kinase
VVENGAALESDHNLIMPGALEPGSSISHYRIVASLGAGGMGEVYKAHDTNLDRAVALKVLPPELVKNDDRVRRFMQEAKSASSLNHPHIVTIHEIGHADSIHFIAMELIDGQTLRSKIHSGDTDLKSLLFYLAQAADGLAKAHAAGIVHRDLKPENIMVTRDGYAKVLDFGLAKLSARKGAEGGSHATTEAREQTREGAVLGTVAYMSPEQVQGKVVDHRSDIFSFGCILYEAATRRRAFDADSDIDVMHKIVHDKPAPIDEINPNVPAELRRMIRRCLAKEPDKRYQSIKDIAIELNDIVEEFDALSASASSRSISVSSPSIPPLRRRITTWIASAAIALVIAAFAIVEWKRSRASSPGPRQSMRLQKVTNSGNVNNAAISPDGRYLAHTVRDDNGFWLVVRQIATGSDIKLVGPSPNTIVKPRFSPDGSYVWYGTYDQPGGPGGLSGSGVAAIFQIAALGGIPKRMLNDVDTPITFSPDSKSIAYGRGIVGKGENLILVAAADGSGERVISTYKRMSPISTAPIEAVWSADGKSVVTVNASAVGGPHDELVQIDVVTRARRTIGPRWFKIWGVAWLPDGKDLLVSGIDNETSQSQLWLQPFPDGQPRRITNDLNLYQYVTVTADGKTLATRQVRFRSRILKAAVNDERGGEPITPELPDQYVQYLDASSNGRIAYALASGSATDIWLLDPPNPPRQLTTDGVSNSSIMSSDGSLIYFRSKRNSDTWHVWSMNVDGSDARQLTRGNGELLLAVSPDGSARISYDMSSAVSRLETARGARTLAYSPSSCAFSPDGQAFSWAELRDNNFRVIVMSVDGKVLLDIPAGSSPRQVDWMPDGKAVTYSRVSGGSRNIWKQPLDGSPATQVTHFKNVPWNWYAWLPDGTVALVREDQSGDAVLISDFR